jgi:hypothetical protein
MAIGETRGGVVGGASRGKATGHTAQARQTTQVNSTKHANKTQRAHKIGHSAVDSFEAAPINSKIKSVVGQLDPANHYQAVGKKTFCNQFAADYASKMGDSSLKGLNANQQYDHLSSPKSGYHAATEAEAIEAAAKGRTAFAAYKNPKGGHGHIAAVVGETGGRAAIAQAGPHNYSFGRVTQGFGQAHSPSYFVRD